MEESFDGQSGADDRSEIASEPEADEAGLPGRSKLGICPVQGCDLPPAGRNQEHPYPGPQERAGADAFATSQGRAEHGKVQRHAANLRLGAAASSSAIISSITPFSEIGMAAYQVKGQSVVTPGHELQHRH